MTAFSASWTFNHARRLAPNWLLSVFVKVDMACERQYSSRMVVFQKSRPSSSHHCCIGVLGQLSSFSSNTKILVFEQLKLVVQMQVFAYLLLIENIPSRDWDTPFRGWDIPFEKYEYGAQNRADRP